MYATVLLLAGVVAGLAHTCGPTSATPPIVALAVSPDGREVLAGSQAGVQVLSLPDLQPQRSLATKLVHVHELVFSPDGKLLAVAGGAPAESGEVEIWEWPAGKLKATLAAGDDVAYDVAWNAEGALLAVAGADRKLRILAVDGAVAKTYEVHSAAVLAVAWLPADDLVLSAGVDHSIRVVEASTGTVRRSLDNHTAAVRDLAVRPGKHDGPLLVASAGADGTVRLWQPTIGRLVRFVRLTSAPTAIGWTRSGSHILAACEDGRLRAVDAESVAVIELAPPLAVRAHALSPIGRGRVVFGGASGVRLVSLDAIDR